MRLQQRFHAHLQHARRELARSTEGYDTAVLEPSTPGARMYRRMGFAPFASYLEGVVPR